MGREKARSGALAFKSFAALLGVVILIFSLLYVWYQLRFLVRSQILQYSDLIALVGAFASLLSGVALTVLFPESMRLKSWSPIRKIVPKKVYGFGTVLAIGIGATMGSPLFILIPLNVVQYSVLSTLSLFFAGMLTFLVAKLYSDMNEIATKSGKNPIGGPSFVSIAVGSRSVRYFLTRVSNWLANITLAAYSALLFILFDLEVLPKIMTNAGFTLFESQSTVYAVDALFAVWFLLNTVFERRFLRLIGYVQIFLTLAMILIIAYQSYLFGSTSSWDLSGFLSPYLSDLSSWPVALLVNTAYLFLLFFGFQEIQSLYNDSVEESSVPILSNLKKGYKMNKISYFRATMLWSVIIALIINIFYAISIYSLHPDLATLSSSAIPGIYLAGKYLGSTQQLITASVFLIATFTTFVPTFMAASRHLSSLAEDGYMPHSLGRLSWLFTLVSIAVLAVGGQDFLVNITDFMMLISLGLIALAAVWMRKGRTLPLDRLDLLPFLTWLFCFIAAGAIYIIQPSTVIFGVTSLIIVYLVYDLVELGVLGVQMMIAVFDTISILAVTSLVRTGGISVLKIPFASLTINNANTLMIYCLTVSAVLLSLNILIDVKILGRTRI